jgi:hypothetical protein
MGDRNRTPIDGPAWVPWVNQTLRALEGMIRNSRDVPVGGMVLWAGGGAPPAGWLAANGATFSTTAYPLLAHRLGASTLPAPVAVSGISWIVRAV